MSLNVGLDSKVFTIIILYISHVQV